MKKRIVTLVMTAVFVLSTTACAKDINEVLQDEIEVSTEPSTEATTEEVTEASTEASEEAAEESSEEVSSESEDASSSETRYENDEFNVAVVIDDDMVFSDQDVLDKMTEEEPNTTGADSGNPMLEALSYTDIVYVAYAESSPLNRAVSVQTATLSEDMHFPESAFVDMTSVRIKVQLEDEFSDFDVTTEETEILGENHSIIKIRYSEDGTSLYTSEFYLIKDGRLLIVTVYGRDEADCDRILKNIEKLD